MENSDGRLDSFNIMYVILVKVIFHRKFFLCVCVKYSLLDVLN